MNKGILWLDKTYIKDGIDIVQKVKFIVKRYNYNEQN